jgi:hypothetical protein
MTEQQLRKQIVDIAVGWLGRKESNGSHKLIIDTYNAHSPRARGYKVSYTDAWCATFVSATFIKAGLTDIAPTECSCSRMIELYKKIGRWKESDSYIPVYGDLIMYDWNDNGVGDNTGAPDHVGIVVSVSGKTIRVIEGNINNSVGYRNIAVNGKYIRGFCVPDYASKVSVSAQKVASAQSRDASAKNGIKFKVSASELNVRSSASSKNSTNIIRAVPKGTTLVWYGYYTGEFYLVQLADKTTGYVHKSYLTKA